MNAPKPWRTISSRTAYENPWITVTEDEVIRPDGSAGIYGVVELRNEAVFVVAIDDVDRVLLVEVERYTVGRSWEVPAGGSDGEDPLVAAQRELLEETGFEADEWTRVGRMAALNGICRAPEVVFVARGLRQLDDGQDRATEGIAAVRAVPWTQVLQMVAGGEIQDGETVAALMFAALQVGRVS